MTKGRLDSYMSLYLWEGGLSTAAWGNFLDGRWSYLVVNGLLVAVTVAIHVAMRRHDYSLERVLDRPRQRVRDQEAS